MDAGVLIAKGSFATFLCGAALSSNLPIRIVVIGAVEEESTSRGAKYVRDRYDPDAVFIGEPSGSNGVVIGYKGQVKGTYSLACAAGHSAGPMDNAAVKFLEFWDCLQSYCSEPIQSTRIFDDFTPQIVSVSGDQSFARLSFDLRVPPSVDIPSFLKFTAGFQGTGTLIIDEIMPAAVYSQNCTPAKSLRRAIRTAGLSPKVKVKTGTCDMNTVCDVWTCPIIAYGPGDSKLDHTVDEHIALKEYWDAVCILQNILVYLSDYLLEDDNRTADTAEQKEEFA